MTLRLLFVFVAAGGWLVPFAASAAESYDNCTGFIDSVPATISTQGTWCLRKDLSTTMESGTAILIQANNVTLDCNDFKVGGLAAGLDTGAYGIRWSNRSNITVRNCSVRGFRFGLSGDGTYNAVEGNRFDGNTLVGINLEGDNHRIVGNQLNDTGGSPGGAGALGIIVSGEHNLVQGNSITGVWASDTANNGNGRVRGISALYDRGSVLQDNRISALVPRGTGTAIAIEASRSLVQGNVMLNAEVTGDIGVDGSTGALSPSLCIGNRFSGYTTMLDDCTSGGGNLSF